jgi:uncharacterized protein YggE
MKALLAPLCLLACAGVASANVTVTGTGKVTYTPDIAVVQVGASSDGKTASEAWQKNAAIVKRVFDALKKMGIAPKDLQTSGLSVSPRYVHPKGEERRLVGYTATYNLTVRVRDLNKLGKVLDEVVDGGANRDMSIRFGCSDPERLLDKARAKAAQEARKKAQVYVQAAGGALGQVQSISEGSSAPWREVRYRHDAVRLTPGDAPLPIAAGEQEMSVSVSVSYGIIHPAGNAVVRG